MAGRKKGNKKNVTAAIGMPAEMKESIVKMADERNITLSGMGRIAFGQLLEEGCNEPIVMLQLIELTQKINDLQEIIPKKKYDSIQKNIGNIMKIKGGK